MTPALASPIVVLTAGRFGTAVASRLTASHADIEVDELATALPVVDRVLEGRSFVFLALWRRYPAETDLIDAICAAHGIPWSSVTIDATELIMGPVVYTPAGPCFRCAERRRAAHLGDWARADTLDAAFNADASIGCEGYLPGAVTLAAASFEADLADLAEGKAALGRIRLLDLIQLDVAETRVPRVHGCERCRAEPGGPDRYLRHLRPYLATGT